MIKLRMRSSQHVVHEKNCTFKTKGKAEFAKPRFRWTDNMIMYYTIYIYGIRICTGLMQL